MRYISILTFMLVEFGGSASRKSCIHMLPWSD